MDWLHVCDHIIWLCSGTCVLLISAGSRERAQILWGYCGLMESHTSSPVFRIPSPSTLGDEHTCLGSPSQRNSDDAACCPQPGPSSLACTHTGLNQHLMKASALKNSENSTFLNNPWYCDSDSADSYYLLLRSLCFLNETHGKLGKLKPVCVFLTIFSLKVNFVFASQNWETVVLFSLPIIYIYFSSWKC